MGRPRRLRVASKNRRTRYHRTADAVLVIVDDVVVTVYPRTWKGRSAK